MANKKVKVLIVEDDEMLAGMYSEKFTLSGYQVEVAHNGSEGIKLAGSFEPAIILLDIIMPKVDGFAALKRLKKNPLTENIPVVMLTNLGQSDDVEKAKKLGALDYFIKANHTPADVIEKVEQVLK